MIARLVTRRDHKSLFGSFSSEKEHNLLFLKKKKQKDFRLFAGIGRGAVAISRVGCVAVVFCLLGGRAGGASTADAFLIVPGARIGLVTLPATEADFLKAYGDEAQPAEVGDVENIIYRTTVLFPCDAKRLAVIFYDSKTRTAQRTKAPPYSREVWASALLKHKDPFPGLRDPVLEGQLPGNENDGTDPREDARVRRSLWWHADQGKSEPQSETVEPGGWHLANGVHAGMTIEASQKVNGRPFELFGPTPDGPGSNSDWRGGKLVNSFWSVTFRTSDFFTNDSGYGQTYLSDDRALDGAKQTVAARSVNTAANTGGPGCKMEKPK